MAGRPKYDWDAILSRLRSGEPVRKIAAEPNMPTATYIYQRRAKDAESTPSPEISVEYYLRMQLDAIDWSTPEGKKEFDGLVDLYKDWFDRRAKLDIAKINAKQTEGSSSEVSTSGI